MARFKEDYSARDRHSSCRGSRRLDPAATKSNYLCRYAPSDMDTSIFKDMAFSIAEHAYTRPHGRADFLSFRVGQGFSFHAAGQTLIVLMKPMTSPGLKDVIRQLIMIIRRRSYFPSFVLRVAMAHLLPALWLALFFLPDGVDCLSKSIASPLSRVAASVPCVRN